VDLTVDDVTTDGRRLRHGIDAAGPTLQGEQWPRQ